MAFTLPSCPSTGVKLFAGRRIQHLLLPHVLIGRSPIRANGRIGHRLRPEVRGSRSLQPGSDFHCDLLLNLSVCEPLDLWNDMSELAFHRRELLSHDWIALQRLEKSVRLSLRIRPSPQTPSGRIQSHSVLRNSPSATSARQIQRLHQMRGHNDKQLRFILLKRGTSEERAENRNISKTGIFIDVSFTLSRMSPPIAKLCPSASSIVVVARLVVIAGTMNP